MVMEVTLKIRSFFILHSWNLEKLLMRWECFTSFQYNSILLTNLESSLFFSQAICLLYCSLAWMTFCKCSYYRAHKVLKYVDFFFHFVSTNYHRLCIQYRSCAKKIIICVQKIKKNKQTYLWDISFCKLQYLSQLEEVSLGLRTIHL